MGNGEQTVVSMYKALLLLAGTGTRLRPLTDELPKPLIDVGGRPLLARSIDSLVACGVTEIVAVTGHLGDKVAEFFREGWPDISVEIIRNEQHDTTNNAYSLLLSRGAFNGCGMILLDGDILYEHRIMQRVVADGGQGSALVVRRSRELGHEEMKVQVDEPSGVIKQIGKGLLPEECYGESIGIARFSPAVTELLFTTLDERIGGRGLINEFYEASFQQMIDRGVELTMLDTAGDLCIEIDTLEDLHFAVNHIVPILDH